MAEAQTPRTVILAKCPAGVEYRVDRDASGYVVYCRSLDGEWQVQTSIPMWLLHRITAWDLAAYTDHHADGTLSVSPLHQNPAGAWWFILGLKADRLAAGAVYDLLLPINLQERKQARDAHTVALMLARAANYLNGHTSERPDIPEKQ